MSLFFICVHFYDSKYDFISDIEINIIKKIPIVTPSHLVLLSIFLPEQCRCITVSVVYCHFLSFFFVFSSRMSANTFFYWRFHRMYFSERSYYFYFSIFVMWNISSQWGRVKNLQCLFSQSNGAVSQSPFFIVIF